jgi:uncharacterized protein (DUF983 family)
MSAGSGDPARSPAAPWRRTCLARGWRGRCPQCGEGRIFERYAKPSRGCAACGHVFRREQGAMTGSMYLSAAVSELFAAAVIFAVVLATDWGVALSLAVGAPLVLAFCAWFLPRSIGLWVAIEYLTDLHNGEPWARPRG